jgi:adenylate cyclase 10
MSAFTLKQELSYLNCKCNIGIATGMVLAGVVGTAGSRREYSVLGDSVNLSARLMQRACTESEEKKIIIDENTAMESVYRIPIQSLETIEVKGKSVKIPIY